MLRHYLIVLSVILNVFCELLNLHEGVKCKDGDALGHCVSIYKCQNAQFFLKTKQFPPICSFHGKDPIVCCTDCNIVDDIRQIVFNPGAGLLPLTGQKANDKCVSYVDELDYPCKSRGSFSRQLDHKLDCYRLRYTKGPNRQPYTESYFALLGYGEHKNTTEWRCAGTIVSENFILTAAHCLMMEKLGPVKYVAVGILNRINATDWQKYDVKRVFPHPEYQTGLKYHDIALIETETWHYNIPTCIKPSTHYQQPIQGVVLKQCHFSGACHRSHKGSMIKFSRLVLPACLHSDPKTTGTDEAGVLIWSSTGENQKELEVFSTYEFSEVQCSFYYPPHDELPLGFNASTQICYGDVMKPEDSCQSDSGSPLLYRRRAFHCTRLILGVMSIDRTCGPTGSSGMYTKVLQYIPWIESIVWP